MAPSSCPSDVISGSPPADGQILHSPPQVPVRIFVPSGENATSETAFACPARVASASPPETDQSFAVSSRPPVNTVWPSGENTAAVTSPSCPRSTTTSRTRRQLNPPADADASEPLSAKTLAATSSSDGAPSCASAALSTRSRNWSVVWMSRSCGAASSTASTGATPPRYGGAGSVRIGSNVSGFGESFWAATNAADTSKTISRIAPASRSRLRVSQPGPTGSSLLAGGGGPATPAP